MSKMKDVCGVKGLFLLAVISSIWVTDAFSQKLKPVVVKKLEDDVYSKEEYSIIKRGKDKGKRHGEYTYSKFAKEITGDYFFDLKDGEWKYNQSPNQFSEYYTKGHLDSVKGTKDGFEILVHFDELGDTSSFRQKIVDSAYVNFLHSSQRDITITFENNGITFETFGDTTFYYYSPKKVLIGKTIKGQKTGKWTWNTSTIKATTFFKDGIPVGTHTSFYPNGKIMAIKSFDSFGEKDGPHVVFYENGDTAYYQEFVNGGEEEPNESYYPARGQQDRYSDMPKPAKFIGGEKRLQLFIETQLEYSAEALKEDKQGVVQVIFVVNSIGEIENPETLGNPDGFLLLEAMRLIKSTSLLWQPAMQDGFPVDMRFRIPLNFQMF